MSDPVTLRAIERLLAVLIGATCVYLGYRLFLQMPRRREGEGKLDLPGGISIYLSRVGPGIFFALFGAGVVLYSLHASVTYLRQTGAAGDSAAAGAARGDIEFYGGIAPVAAAAGARGESDQRLRRRLEMELLNRLPALLRSDLTAEEERWVRARLESAKLALIEPVWDPGWGSFEEFRAWAEEGGFDPVPAGLEPAAEYYRAGERSP